MKPPSCGVTFVPLHAGHWGFAFSRSESVMTSSNGFLHFSQRNSYLGIGQSSILLLVSVVGGIRLPVTTSYWMISCARATTDWGIVRPRTLALFILITSSTR